MNDDHTQSSFSEYTGDGTSESDNTETSNSSVESTPSNKSSPLANNDDSTTIDPSDIALDGESFNDYWFQQIAKRNEEENHPERNDPGHSWPLGRIEPHQLGNCKRQWMYHWLNAPKEDADPHGIFAIGHYIEEEIIEPWLIDEFEPEFSIDNAVHVSTDIDELEFPNEIPDPPVDTGVPIDVPDDVGVNQQNNAEPVSFDDAANACITIAGSTDPAIRGSDSGEILCLTEVKSTGNIDRLGGTPKTKHLYQIHAYMHALEIENGFIIYVDRNELLSPVVFEVSFSQDVWDTITDWVTETVSYAANETLPPADPPKDYMCQYCSYRNRCGEGRSNLVEDMDTSGFVPGYTEYPKTMVEDHLQAYSDVKLTPSLALTYPELTEEYSVEQWVCPNCTAEFTYTDSHFSDYTNKNYETPHCPACQSVFDKNIYLRTKSTV